MKQQFTKKKYNYEISGKTNTIKKSHKFYRLVAYILSYFVIKIEILLIMINNQEAKKPDKWVMPRTQVWG